MPHPTITLVDRSMELRRVVEDTRQAAQEAEQHYLEARQAWNDARQELDSYLHHTNR